MQPNQRSFPRIKKGSEVQGILAIQIKNLDYQDSYNQASSDGGVKREIRMRIEERNKKKGKSVVE
jgi:hypothetical protein